MNSLQREEPASECKHAVQFNSLCVFCGKDLSKSDEQATHYALHNTTNLKLSVEEAQKQSTASLTRLMSEKRLSLVIDLDQTILHATTQIDPQLLLPDSSEEIHTIHIASCPHYIKLRPHLRTFLARMLPLFEMHIYTMGSREYAKRIVALIDEEGLFFGDRVVTRDENDLALSKSLKRIFPVNEHIAVIIDDRIDVWGNCPNLVQVKPYCFFRGVGDIHAPIQTILSSLYSACGKEGSSSPTQQTIDCELENIEQILTMLHFNFFESPELRGKDVDLILQCMRSSVLSGKYLVFSGVFPLSCVPFEQQLWKKACEFGAVCCTEIHEGITHLIVSPSNAQTAKAKRASRMPGVKIVHLSWLLCCFEQWTAVEEEEFLVHVEQCSESEGESESDDELAGLSSESSLEEEEEVPQAKRQKDDLDDYAQELEDLL